MCLFMDARTCSTDQPIGTDFYFVEEKYDNSKHGDNTTIAVHIFFVGVHLVGSSRLSSIDGSVVLAGLATAGAVVGDPIGAPVRLGRLFLHHAAVHAVRVALGHGIVADLGSREGPAVVAALWPVPHGCN